MNLYFCQVSRIFSWFSVVMKTSSIVPASDYKDIIFFLKFLRISMNFYKLLWTSINLYKLLCTSMNFYSLLCASMRFYVLLRTSKNLLIPVCRWIVSYLCRWISLLNQQKWMQKLSSHAGRIWVYPHRYNAATFV